MNPRPHYFCHISLMLLSTAALAAQVMSTVPATATPRADVVPTDIAELPAA